MGADWSSRFPIYLGMSLFIHFGMALAMPEDSAEIPVAWPSNSNVISIGIQTAMAGTFNSQPVSESLPKLNSETVKVEEVAPEQVKQQPPQTTGKPILQPQKKPDIKQQPEKKPEALPKPPELEQQPTPQQARPAMKAGHQGVSGSSEAPLKQTETRQKTTEGGAREAAFDSYVLEHLLARKKNPRLLKRRRLKADVMVEFVIDRHGALLQSSITKPSRIREFDRAAIKLIKTASPFPRAPEYVGWDQRRYEIVLNYEVR